LTLRLFLAQPTIIFAALVNQGSFAYPIAQVTFDGVTTGAYGDIVPGMTVLFGSTAGGDEYGRQRVRKAATSSILYFGRSSRGTRDGEVDLADNAYIAVLNDYRVWSKIPYIDDDAVVYKDNDIAVGTHTTTPPPVANAGVPMAGTIDSGTDLLRVTLPGTGAKASFAVSGTISSYAWVLPSGVALVGGYALSDAQIEVDCNPGFYWVALTVTDSNAETHTVHVPIYARDPAADTSIASFSVEAHRKTTDGQRIAVRILEDIPEATYPDGTLVMLWEDEPSTGADRSHMVFWGWHQTDPATIAAERIGILRDVMFDCLDVAGKLDTLPGFPLSVEVAASPASWAQMTAPNMDKYLHYLLHWHSTALEVADWSWSGTTTTYPFVVLGNAGESLWDQIARRAKALVPDYVLGCNTHGQLQTIVDPMLQDSGSRTATVQATLEEADWQSIRYTHQRPPRAHWLRGEAILASNTTLAAIFCIAPGESPGQGETPFSQGEQLAPSQAALNACEGHRYGRHNASQGYFSIILAEGDDQGIEPADMTWVRLNVSADTAAQRGLTFSNERGLVREMNVRYDHTRTGLVKSVELLWERETSGTPAVTVLLPAGGLPNPEWEPPDLSYDPAPEILALGDPPGKPVALTYVLINGQYTTNWEDSPPTWNDTSAPSDMNRTNLMPGSSVNRLFGYAGWGLFSGTDVIWEYAPLPLGTGSWSAKWSAAQIATLFGHAGNYTDVCIFRIASSLDPDQEEWAWASGRVDYEVDSDDYTIAFMLHTRDGWDTIKYSLELFDLGPDDGDPYWTLGYDHGVAIDYHSGYVYASLAKTTTGAGTDPGWVRLYRSQDHGFTATLAKEVQFDNGDDSLYGTGDRPSSDVWVPYKSDTYTGGTVVWTAAVRGSPNTLPFVFAPMVYYSQNHALTAKDIGNDGGLPTALNALLGPWNSIDRVWGMTCLYYESTTDPGVYTWRDGYGWTLFNEDGTAFGRDCQLFAIKTQDGYLPETVIFREEPFEMDDVSVIDKAFPSDAGAWITVIP